MKSLEIDSYTYKWIDLIFNKGVKEIQWRTNSLFNKWYWNNIVVGMKEFSERGGNNKTTVLTKKTQNND